MENITFEEIKQAYIENIKEFILNSGGLFPHIAIFADIKKPKKDDNKPAIIHIPIPDEYMENESTKDRFIQNLIPEIFLEIRKDFIPKGVAWAAEAWMRVADKDFDSEKDDWKNLPKKEVVIITIETKEQSETLVYNMKRVGKEVNSEGNLIDTIILEKEEGLDSAKNYSGRFTGLFKKFNDDVK